MPINGQAAANQQISNFFDSVLGNGSNQKLAPYRNSTVATATQQQQTNPAAPPPTAAAAPSKASNSLFTGLCEALNAHQQDLVKSGTYEVADQYAILFAPPAMGSATVTPPGPTVYSNTPTQTPNTAAAKLNPATDTMNTNAQTWSVLAGTQIVQLIDQVMRGSSYIRDQQKAQIDANNKQTTSASTTNNGVTAWYKISVQATQLAYDNKRRDHAYKMTFVVTPYAINQMSSPFFNDSKYRGAHKAYNYWFTGSNTEILSYEQEYNHAYYLTLNNNAGQIVQQPPTGRDQFSKTFMAASEVRGQGQPNYINNPADSAASFLYSVTDFGQVRLKIVGDPAWLQQGEVATGVSPTTFNFNPFNPDGGINYDSQELVFTVSFNRPTDYDFNTGIVNANAGNGQPQETFAYIAKTCKSVFSKGQFTQELVGTLLPLTTAATGASSANARPVSNSINGVAGSATSALSSAGATVLDSRTSNITNTVASSQALATQTSNNGTVAPTGLTTDTGSNTINPPTTQPAAPPGAPTSSGDITAIQSVQANYNTNVGGFTPPADAAAAVAAANGDTYSPQQIANDDSGN